MAGRYFIRVAVMAALVGGTVAEAAVVRVPADHETIQAAVSAAAAGDTVLVAPGEYRELIHMKAGVVLKSEKGPESTTLFGPDLGEDATKERVIEIFEGDRSTVVEGFSFLPTEIAGAAIYVENASPTIRGNDIRTFGYGIHLRHSKDALIEDNRIEGCLAFGILMRASSPKIYRNDIARNQPRALSIAGKESVPVIGGSPENGNKIYGQMLAIVNDSKNDIIATHNDWGYEVTSEMDRLGYPGDVSAITDGHDVGKSHRGRGEVDYRHWVTAAPSAGGGGGGGAVPIWGWLAGGAVALLLLFIAMSRRSASAS